MAPTSRGQEDARNTRKAKVLTNESGLFESLARFWQTSYAADYIGLAILAALLLLLETLAEPFHQLFLLSDVRIQRPHAEVQTVDVFFLFLYALVVPFIVLALWNLGWRRDTHKAHVSILGLAISIILTSLITDILKNAIGRPRPDLIDRCKPLPGTETDVLVSVDVCTEKGHHTLHDGEVFRVGILVSRLLAWDGWRYSSLRSPGCFIPEQAY
jgi:diacylglycerol diphosphate phosphatase / phosphatidate phosphatase